MMIVYKGFNNITKVSETGENTVNESKTAKNKLIDFTALEPYINAYQIKGGYKK